MNAIVSRWSFELMQSLHVDDLLTASLIEHTENGQRVPREDGAIEAELPPTPPTCLNHHIHLDNPTLHTFYEKSIPLLLSSHLQNSTRNMSCIHISPKHPIINH